MEIKTSTRGYELVGVGEGEEYFAKAYADDVVASHQKKTPMDHPDGSVTDEKIGTRTVRDQKGVNMTATLSEHLEGLYTAVKDEITARSAAVAEETAARKMADETEKNERTAANEAEAAARVAALAQEAAARTEALAQETQARRSDIATEATSRTVAITEEAQARKTADETEKNERIAADEAEAAARTAALAQETQARTTADNALAESLDALSSATVKSVNGAKPNSAGNVNITISADGVAARTYRQCIVNGNFRRGTYGWKEDVNYSSACTLSVTAPGVAVMTVPEPTDYGYYYYRTVSNAGKSGEKNGNYRYFLRIIISSVSEESKDGWAYNGYGGINMASFSLAKKNQFEIGGKTYSEYIGVCNNSDAAPYAFMLAPFKSLSPGEYTILEQIAVELPEGDELYDMTADELYEYFSEYKEGQYVL